VKIGEKLAAGLNCPAVIFLGRWIVARHYAADSYASGGWSAEDYLIRGRGWKKAVKFAKIGRKMRN